MRSIRPEQVLRGTREHGFSCLYYAVLNFFVWVGADPPALADLLACVRSNLGEGAARVDVPEDTEEWARMGLNIGAALALLGEFEFPRVLALGFLPKGKTARDVFPALLSQGYGVLFAYRWELEGRGIAHAGVVTSCSDEWLEFMDSNPAYFTGRLLPLVDDGTAFPADEVEASLALPHGSLSLLGWETLSDDTLPLVPGRPAGGVVGIERVFIVALPV